MTENIYIEGIPGCGKTTLLNKLGESLTDYKIYSEGDFSPIELAWCSYMTEIQYNQVLLEFPELNEDIRNHTVKEDTHYIVAYTRIHTDKFTFYQHMEQFEIYSGRKSIEEFKNIIFHRLEHYKGYNNIFECSFFQNIMDELILFALYDNEQIVDFYREMVSYIDLEHLLLIRLESKDIENTILQIKRERVNEKGEEDWYPMMMEYLGSSTYGQLHHFSDCTDLVEYFKRRIKVEEMVMTEVLKEHCIHLESKNFDFDNLLRRITGK